MSEHGVVRWRRIDLSHLIETRFGIHLAERSVGDLLRRLGFRRLSARPRHTGHDAAAKEAHKRSDRRRSPATRPWQTNRTLVARRSAGRPTGNAAPALGKAGRRPSAPRDYRYKWAHIFGAGPWHTGAALVLPFVNAAAMNRILNLPRPIDLAQGGRLAPCHSLHCGSKHRRALGGLNPYDKSAADPQHLVFGDPTPHQRATL